MHFYSIQYEVLKSKQNHAAIADLLMLSSFIFASLRVVEQKGKNEI
jgi:hypothetical protein